LTVDPLVQAFFEEAAELVTDYEAGLLRLEETPDDGELLNRIFRAAHTLKGNSAMLGFEAVARFTHVLEDLLDQLRKGRRSVTPRVVDALLASGDVIRGLLAGARGESAVDEATVATVVDALKALLDGREPVAPAAPPPAPAPPSPSAGGRTLYEIVFRPPADLLRRGLDPEAVIRDVGALGELVQVSAATDALPPLDDLDPEQCYLSWRLWLLSERPRSDVEACFEFVCEPSAVTIDALPMDPEPGAAPPAEAATAAAPVAAAAATAPAPAREARLPAPSPAPASAETTTIRVPVEKVDRLINLVGELVITQSMVAQTVASFSMEKLARLQEAVSQMDRHARELHERMMAVRMVPIKALFGRFPRLVRDLTAAVGKQAALEVAGEDTELDKTVIEKIGDPLTHLIRNSIDHGIEPPDARRAAGKPLTGSVRLEAYQQGGSIYIEVADDGKGLDRERIVAKAVQQGLIAPDQAPTDEDAFALIFRPGFSTAETITEVSGRGVGMDVVRRNVDALGGSIGIQSQPGRGTTFTVKLPLTLAIVDGQSLQVGQEIYILPLVSIVESIRPRRETTVTVLGSGEVVMIRGQVLPILRLHRLFGVETRVHDPIDGLLVIVEHEGRRVALLVDELLGQQQVVIKSLEANFERMDGISGATILGDGRVALILDVPGLIGLARAADLRSLSRPAA
jgi:two-component system chemotaxis sensor kinase CheA